MAHEKRRKVLVHRRIQGALVRQLLMHWVIFVVMTCVVSMAVQWLIDPLSPAAVKMYQLRVTAGVFFAVSLCLIPIFMRASVKLSHRVVGPVVRMHSLIKQAARGEKVTHVKLRRGDFWQDFSQDVNEMLDRVQERQPSPADTQPMEFACTGESRP